jgi:hypothetical protein
MTRWQVKATQRRRLAWAGAAALVAVAVVAIVALVTGGGSDDVAAGPSKDKAASIEAEVTTSTTAAPSTTTAAAPSTTTSTAAPATTAPPTTAPPATAPAAPGPGPASGGALCIGDSVMLAASPEFTNTLSMCGTVDATESRQASVGPDVLGSHAPFPATVVIHLGTNGTVDGADLDAMLGQLRGVGEVVLVNVQHNGTRSWERQANSAIAAGAGRFGNVRLADWKGASNGHRDWFAADGIHLSAAGARAYADVIAGTLYAP